jgi:hypothetical protein
MSKTDKPQYLNDLKELEANGGFDLIEKWMNEKIPVWILRSSGQWQKAYPISFGYGGLQVTVAWDDQDKPNKHNSKFNQFKSVDTLKLLEWQEETKNIDESALIAEEMARKVRSVLRNRHAE